MQWDNTKEVLRISDFEETKNESRENDRLRVEHLMSGDYEDAFRDIVRFLTKNEDITLVEGDQINYNVNTAMARVAVKIAKGAGMMIPGDATYQLEGPRAVSEVIRASFRFHIAFMMDPHRMRTQQDSFREELAIMQAR
jgi:hypothetical protein